MAEREECAGIAAQWCPNCGTCNCPLDHNGERTRDRATCPLHGVESRHAETLCAGGCGEMVTDDGERCDACELRRLRAIVEGRTELPTEEEIAAHAAACGGAWLVAFRGCVGVYTSATVRSHINGVSAGWWRADEARWWALDADGRPCAWPVVTEAPSR